MDQLTVEQAQVLCLSKNIPFYSYRLPGKEILHFGAQLQTKVEVFDEGRHCSGKEGFIVVPFQESDNTPSLFIQGELVFQNAIEDYEIIRKLREPKERIVNQKTPLESVTPEEYHNQVTTMISALQQGDVRKLVLSRGVTIEVEGYRQASLWFKKLAAKYPEAFVFLVSIPGVMTWIGATPEILLEQTENEVRTMALAGTRPIDYFRGWGPKEVEEQAIVAEYISSLLENLGEWRVEGPFSKKAGNIEHLCTLFSCSRQLSKEEIGRLRKKLHPTPAVGGFPKQRALALIAEIEKRDRRYYAGYIGPVHANGTFEWFVNLRCMEIFPQAVHLYIGGGITALSDPLEEWEETELKSRTLLDVIR